MKKIVLLAALTIMVLTGNARAIIVDGIVSSPGEWAGYQLLIHDPDEAIPNDHLPGNYSYDVDNFYVDDGLELFFRFDLYGPGSPTLSGINPGLQALYHVYLDFDEDGQAEVLASYNDGITHLGEQQVWIYHFIGTNWVEVGQGQGGIGSIVEMSIPPQYLSDWAPICEEVPVWVRAFHDNSGGPSDDNIPDLSGTDAITWSDPTTIHLVPEPTSMLLLGIGLIGLAGGRIRKRFRA